MNTHPFPLAGWLAMAAGLLSLASRAGDPFVPASDDAILVRLHASARLVAPTPASAPTLDAALADARALVRQARATGDPRPLGRAQAILRPWWNDPVAPLDAVLLRAEIHQALHRFPAALEDLDLALHLAPRNADAWLMKATLHGVQGDLPAARRACLQLARLADPLLALTASASVTGLGPGGASALSPLAAAIDRHTDAPPDVLAWANTTLGELRAWHGDVPGAERALRRSIELQPRSPYPVAALADLLLDQNRHDDVLALPAISDLVAQRHAEARLRRGRDPELVADYVRRQAEAIELARARGDALHLREEARFELRLRGRPDLALPLAQRNWEIQKEPADLALLLEAARAAGRPEAAADARSWARENQPVVLNQLDSRP